ncbi:MAG: hypothetical protein UY85_C0030G0018 [Candidatus Peribacteria bacterium GW2011_GWB1_54_5]|nr:MAG: hypothetical protein UY85_C0030G0018 [Candidatus Peribacteria bacterium GW2011_GWB1_54_5]
MRVVVERAETLEVLPLLLERTVLPDQFVDGKPRFDLEDWIH